MARPIVSGAAAFTASPTTTQRAEPAHAASRANEVLDAGDLDGRAVWLRIHEAVLELGREVPGEGERVQ